MSNQLCNLGVTYPDHSVQICRSNKTILTQQRTSSCRTLHCPSCPMMDSSRMATLQADRDPRTIEANQPRCQRTRSLTSSPKLGGPSSASDKKPVERRVEAPIGLYRKRNEGVIREVIAILSNLHLRRQPCSVSALHRRHHNRRRTCRIRHHNVRQYSGTTPRVCCNEIHHPASRLSCSNGHHPTLLSAHCTLPPA
jgi:hypothetical protein